MKATATATLEDGLQPQEHNRLLNEARAILEGGAETANLPLLMRSQDCKCPGDKLVVRMDNEFNIVVCARCDAALTYREPGPSQLPPRVKRGTTIW